VLGTPTKALSAAIRTADGLPMTFEKCPIIALRTSSVAWNGLCLGPRRHSRPRDRKSTRLNSSHVSISYAVFCLKKKKQIPAMTATQLNRRAHTRGAADQAVKP